MSNSNTDNARLQSRFFGLTPKEAAKSAENYNLAVQLLLDVRFDTSKLSEVEFQTVKDVLVEFGAISADLMEYSRLLVAHERVVADALARSQNQKEQRQSRQGGNNRRGGNRRPRKN